MERRGAERYEASSVVEFSFGKQRAKAEVSDLSLAGCRLDKTGIELSRGDAVDLHFLEGIDAAGTVCWADETSAGIKFAVPITMATLAYFRFAEGISVTVEADFDKFGRRLPPLGAQAGSR